MSERVKMVSSLLTSPTVRRKDSCTDRTAMPLQALPFASILNSVTIIILDTLVTWLI